MEYSDEEESNQENALLTFMRSHSQLTVRQAISSFMQEIKQRVGTQMEEKAVVVRGVREELRRGMAGR
jgi:tellurite resistance protein